MRMLTVIALVALAATLSLTTDARGQEPKCPTISVACPVDPVAKGQPITFIAELKDGDPNASPTYNWAVSAGTISSGQGTSAITVDTAGLEGNTSVTATVEIGEIDPACTSTSSCTSSIAPPGTVAPKR